MGDTRDYLHWHDAYEQPGSPLHRRLQIVIRLIRRAFDDLPPGPIRVVSLCAGQGADLLGAADGHPQRAHDLTGRMVELNRQRRACAVADRRARGSSACRSSKATRPRRTPMRVRCRPTSCWPAASSATSASRDIERTIRFLPALCAPGAWVVWTRHPRDEELFERLQRWLVEVGLQPIEVVVADDTTFGVGANRLAVDPPPFRAGEHLFTFLY